MRLILLLLIVIASTACVLAQSGAASTPSAGEDRMATPTPVSSGGYSTDFAAETPRTNYLKAGLSLSAAYDDNIGAGIGTRIKDQTYSIWPTIELDQTRSRLGWTLSYIPGFTFYQHTTSLDQADHNLSATLHYWLSPHVELKMREGFRKTSNVFNPTSEQTLTGGPSGVIEVPNVSIIPPASEQTSNFSNIELTYQFGLNSMVGAKGTYSIQNYSQSLRSAGLFESQTAAGEVFYSHRLALKHYVGLTYQFQNLLTKPSIFRTQTQSAVLFYTFMWAPGFSISVFGGPEYAQTRGDFAALHTVTPLAGASVGWQRSRTSLAISFARRVSDGGGLPQALVSETGEASVRRQLAKRLSAGISGMYARNKALNPSLPGAASGHTAEGSAYLEQSLSDHASVQLGYSRLHQSYGTIAALSSFPDRNRVWVTLSFGLERPLGR